MTAQPQLTSEQLLERFIAELAEDETTLPMVSAYDGQIAQMQAFGASFDDILAIHDVMFAAYARARGWTVTLDAQLVPELGEPAR